MTHWPVCYNSSSGSSWSSDQKNNSRSSCGRSCSCSGGSACGSSGCGALRLSDRLASGTLHRGREVKVYVGDSKIDGAGKGLFAAEEAQPNCSVARFGNTRKVRVADWLRHRDLYKLPEDACVYLGTHRDEPKYAYYDAAFTDPANKPEWYLIDHTAANRTASRELSETVCALLSCRQTSFGSMSSMRLHTTVATTSSLLPVAAKVTITI